MDKRYTQLADRIGLGQSLRMAGIFATIADETEADIMLALPGQPPQVAEKLGLSVDEVEKRLQGMFIKGVTFAYTKTDPPTWRMVKDLVQFHDASLLWPNAPEKYIDQWREFMNEEWFTVAKQWAKVVKKPFTRVIPVGISITPRTQILDFESVKGIIERAKTISVTKCTCRLSMRNCDRPLEVCLQVNKGADYNIARGSGRQIDQAEAMDILRKSEEEGLIHVTMNRGNVDNFICNCCPCCCQTMPVLIKGGVKVVDPSRFAARIEADDCTGCGVCHERCYFGAISFTDGEGSPSLVDPEKCMGCGLCMVTCPEEAIAFDQVRPEEFVPGTVEK